MWKYVKIILIIIFSFSFLSVELKAQEEESASFYFKKAQGFFQTQDNKSALAYYSKALNAKPSNAQQQLIWFRIGTIYEIEKEYEKAIIAYKKGVSLGKSNWEGYFNLGRIYQIVALDDLAISSYREVIKIRPEIFQVWFNLSKIYQRKKLYNRALECYKKAQSINESNVEIYLELVNIYEKLGRLDIASFYLQDILTLYPREEYFSRLGFLYFSRDMLDKAIGVFQKILDKEPHNQEVRLSLGYIYFKKGSIKSCINEFTKVINSDPNNALAYFLRGLVYYRDGKDNLSKKDCLCAYRNAEGEMLKLYAKKILNKLNQSQ